MAVAAETTGFPDVSDPALYQNDAFHPVFAEMRRAGPVHFCPESPLSGVGYTDFIEAMWYHRTIQIQEDWKDKRIILHFGAVDYESELFIDGTSVGTHFGGTVSFSHDITPHVGAGKPHHLVLRVLDELRKGAQPRGKQHDKYRPWRASYSRPTGIWQTVWMEAIDVHGLKDVHIVPDLAKIAG